MSFEANNESWDETKSQELVTSCGRRSISVTDVVKLVIDDVNEGVAHSRDSHG